jgi:predicted unusual protein kinase regulating ubiquinone biosynthesis (AarF/ABC1/UbiB family)
MELKKLAENYQPMHKKHYTQIGGALKKYGIVDYQVKAEELDPDKKEWITKIIIEDELDSDQIAKLLTAFERLDISKKNIDVRQYPNKSVTVFEITGQYNLM